MTSLTMTMPAPTFVRPPYGPLMVEPQFGPAQRVNDGLSVRMVTIAVDATDAAVRSLTYALYYVTGDAGLPHLLAHMATAKAVGLDLETSDLKPKKGKIATLQIGNPHAKEPWAYVVDLRSVSRVALQPVLDRIAARDIVKLGQNVKFECSWLQYHYNCRPRAVADTQQAEQVIRAGLYQAKAWKDGGPASERAAYKYSSMAWLAKFYLNLELDKDLKLRTGFYTTPVGQHDDRQLAYAAGDVIFPFYIADKQKTEIANRALRGIIKIEFELIPVLADAELTGMTLDTVQWRVLWQEAIQRRAAAEKTLDDLIRPFTGQRDLFDTSASKERPIFPKMNKPLNYDSPAQLKWVIDAYCKGVNWPTPIITTESAWIKLKEQHGGEWLDRKLEQNARARELAAKLGKEPDIKEVSAKDIPDHVVPWGVACAVYETDKNTLTLRMVRKQLPQELVRALLEYGKYSIRCDTFGNEFINKHVDPDDGRLHTEFHQCITNTGRLSASPNTMNIPKDARYRKCFVAGKGKKLFLADYSQIEPRLSADVSGDSVYTAAFIAGRDLYLTVAEAMFAQEIDKSTVEGKRLRDFAKILVLGLAYRMGPWKLMDTITLAMAEDIMSGAVPMPTFEYVQGMYERFFEECSGIRAYQDLCSNIADPKRTDRPKLWDEFLGEAVTWITGPCGRHRFFGPEAKAVFTEAPNGPIQGASATITKAAAVLFQQWIDERGYVERCHIVNLVHDEIVGEADEEIAQECADALKHCMERAGAFYIKSVPVVAEFPAGTTGVVDYWMKELKAA